MKLSTIANFSSENFPNAKDETLIMIDKLNQLIDAVNGSLQNNIDITNNLLAERQTVNMEHGVPVQVFLQTLKQTPRFVRAGFADGQFVTACHITDYDAQGLNPIVTINFEAGAGTTADVELCLEP